MYLWKNLRQGCQGQNPNLPTLFIHPFRVWQIDSDGWTMATPATIITLSFQCIAIILLIMTIYLWGSKWPQLGGWWGYAEASGYDWKASWHDVGARLSQPWCFRGWWGPVGAMGRVPVNLSSGNSYKVKSSRRFNCLMRWFLDELIAGQVDSKQVDCRTSWQ